ncbi:MAG TPA: hypothetical protein VF712_15960 [Thermoleophilaceae bacterium]|jgi:hypothetical protein
MARLAVKPVSALDAGLVLAPERYDPRRYDTRDGLRLAELAQVSRETVGPKSAPDGRYLILDTSDAREGVIVTTKAPVPPSSLGSTKKVAKPGDVLISRLRPYLRQAAYVDGELTETSTTLVCSTEFYVLRARDEQSVAFLVAFLLGPSAQSVLAAAQEGGHHPRFNQATLEELVVPEEVVRAREEISRAVEEAAHLTRRAERRIREAVELVQA